MDLLPEPNVHYLHGDAAPLAALLDGDDVPPVAVEVHHVRVQVVDGQPGSSHGITPFAFVAPTMISKVPSARTAARRPRRLPKRGRPTAPACNMRANQR
jgi:hypothetical protein